MSHLQFAIQEMLYRLNRTVAVVGALALAVGLSLTTYTLSDAYVRAVALPFQNVSSDLVLQRSGGASVPSWGTSGSFLPADAQPFTTAEAETIRMAQGVKSVAGSILFWSADEGAMRVVIGVDPAADFGASSIRQYVRAGRFFQPAETGKAIVDEHFAAFYQVRVGQSSVNLDGKRFEVIGIARPPVSGTISAAGLFIPLADAQALLGLPQSAVNTLEIQVLPAASVDSLQDSLVKSIPGLRPVSALGVVGASETLTGYAARFARIILGMIATAAVFVVYWAIVGSIRGRTTQIAVLKTLGWTLSDLRRQIELEVLLQSVAGSLIGLLFGLLLIPGMQSLRVEDGQAARWVVGISGSDGFHGHVPSVPLAARFDPLMAIGLTGAAIALALVAAHLVTRRLAILKPTVLLGEQR